VNCRCCNGEAKKFGKFKNVNRIVQRYRCLKCGTTFSDSQPLTGLRVDLDKACQVVHLLCEGMGIRAIERFTGLHRDTVLSILESAGEHCARLLDARIRNVNGSWLEVDEIHTYVLKKEVNTDETGEFFTYLSADMSSKLIVNYLVGKRNRPNTEAFLQDLKTRMAGRFQLTTDAYQAYCRGGGAVGRVFGNDIDYATEKKIYSQPISPKLPNTRPATLIAIKRVPRIGRPDMKLATICHTERLNLSVRQFTKRFTRKTLGFSKKLENLRHAVALFVAHFNFVRTHGAHGRTPAQAANLTNHAWTINEMLSATI